MTRAKKRWVDGAMPAKIGTVPTLVQVHGCDLRKLRVGETVRVRESERGAWTGVRVTHVGEGKHFRADR